MGTRVIPSVFALSACSLSVFALLLPAGAQSPPGPGHSLASLDRFLDEQRIEWKVPGLAVAVVRDDRVIHEGVYGTTDGPNKAPITRQTLFGIGSVTKSMTVAVLQTLVEEGKLDWDRPVRDFAPDFRLRDPVITGQVTLRDLVSHRTGLPRHDALWFRSSLSRPELFQRLRYLDFSAGLREKYQYNNLMYMAAGVVAERAAQTSWEDLVRRRVLQPLQLTTANTSVTAPGDYAVENRLAIDAVGPAGSVNATIGEFARYLRMHINAGVLEGVRVLPEKRAREMQTAQTPIHEPIYEEFGEASYGMGFFLGRYAGRKVVYHTGTISGYHALLAFLPEERVGLVLLMNRVERSFPKMVSAHIFDLLLGRPVPDWAAKYRELDKKTAAAASASKPPRSGTSPSRDFSEFAGVYTHPAYGDITVTAEKGFQWTGHATTLEHFHFDVFQAKSTPGNALNGLKLQFRSDPQGDVRDVCIALESALPPIVFARQAP
jgi:CubicO group peptidase (beta-lactamase class C family)